MMAGEEKKAAEKPAAKPKPARRAAAAHDPSDIAEAGLPGGSDAAGDGEM